MRHNNCNDLFYFNWNSDKSLYFNGDSNDLLYLNLYRNNSLYFDWDGNDLFYFDWDCDNSLYFDWDSNDLFHLDWDCHNPIHLDDSRPIDSEQSNSDSTAKGSAKSDDSKYKHTDSPEHDVPRCLREHSPTDHPRPLECLSLNPCDGRTLSRSPRC